MGNFESMESLLGRNLDGFHLVSMTEIYKTDDDGRRASSLVVIPDPKLAETLVSQLPESYSYRTRNVFILTNEEVNFLIGDQESVRVIGSMEAREQIKANARKKLSDGELAVLDTH